MLFLHPEESKRMTSYLVKVIITCYADVTGMEEAGHQHCGVLDSTLNIVSLNLY